MESRMIRPNWLPRNTLPRKPTWRLLLCCLESCKVSAALKPLSKPQLDLTINPCMRPPWSWFTWRSTSASSVYYNAINAGSGFWYYTLIELNNYWPIIQSIASGEMVYSFFRLWHLTAWLSSAQWFLFISHFLSSATTRILSAFNLRGHKRQRQETTMWARKNELSSVFAGKYRGGSSLQTGDRGRSLHGPVNAS